MQATLRQGLEELALIADGWYRRVTLAWPYAGGHVEIVGDAGAGPGRSALEGAALLASNKCCSHACRMGLPARCFSLTASCLAALPAAAVGGWDAHHRAPMVFDVKRKCWKLQIWVRTRACGRRFSCLRCS